MAPGRTAAMPAARHRWATDTTCRASGVAAASPPMMKVAEVSPWNPPSFVVTSTLRMSPRRSTTPGEGMPWQTTSLRLVQTAAGKPW